MTLIGMLHYRKNPFDVRKAIACAAIAKIEEVNFFYFSYGSVNFEKETIDGWIYENRNWKRKQMDFPDVIINISSPKSEKQSFIYKKLRKKCKFTSFSVGNKIKVYKKIVRGKQFSDFLIPTYKLNNDKNVLALIKKHNKIVMKPISGNHGKGIYFVEKIDPHSFLVIKGDDRTLYSKNTFISFVNSLSTEKKYLVQPFVECKTKSGLTYDIRLHVQKNGAGSWEITLIYPRISGNSKMVSNVKSGGYRGELIPFLQEEFGEDYFNIKRLLEHFAISFIYHFESLYPKDFDELGIDVGIDENKKLWIYEVNWRPGSKHREFEVAKRLIPYAMFLAN